MMQDFFVLFFQIFIERNEILAAKAKCLVFIFQFFTLYASLTEWVFIQINENNFGFLDFITTIRYQPINRVMIDT